MSGPKGILGTGARMDGEEARIPAAAIPPESPPPATTGLAATAPTSPALADPSLAGPENGPAFTQGSILRHVLVMTATSTIGIMAIFAVDLLSLLYVARLGETALTAAVGYASQMLFFAVSINIGVTIGVTALVARSLGAHDRARARQLAASGCLVAAAVSVLTTTGMLTAVHPILRALGASGEVEAAAARYLMIAMPANVPLALGMVLSGVLRAAGDARRAMYVTLGGAIVTGIVDPILIFGLGLGIDGAAISTVLSRFVFLAVGTWGVVRVHGLLGRPTARGLAEDLPRLWRIALPAVVANLATPVGNGYVLHVFSRFGSDAIAACTVADRIVPVAFAVLFALSGAVGPILAQNLGARRYDRVNGTLSASFGCTVVYVVAVWVILWLAAPLVVALFSVDGDAARYVVFFCRWGVSAWLFIGFLFVANASFNNLGFPWLAMLFNWGRATLGTAPFVTLGAAAGGVEGGQLGIAFGAAIFGLGALVTAYKVTARLAGRITTP